MTGLKKIADAVTFMAGDSNAVEQAISGDILVYTIMENDPVDCLMIVLISTNGLPTRGRK